MTMRRVLLVTLVIAALWPGNAFAHGDLKRSDPERGDHVRKPPDTIELDFAEPPTADSRFEVTDGCGEDVQLAVSGEGPHAVLDVADGAPGLWRVTYRTVSSVDGHVVSGAFRFHVGNRGSCRVPPLRGAEPSETVDIGAPGPPISNDDGGLPIVPIALAGVGIVGVALLIRRMGGA